MTFVRSPGNLLTDLEFTTRLDSAVFSEGVLPLLGLSSSLVSLPNKVWALRLSLGHSDTFPGLLKF